MGLRCTSYPYIVSLCKSFGLDSNGLKFIEGSEALEAEEWLTLACLGVYLVQKLVSNQPLSCCCALSLDFGICMCIRLVP